MTTRRQKRAYFFDFLSFFGFSASAGDGAAAAGADF